MTRWSRGRYAIEMTDEPYYSFGSTDNPHVYEHEYLLEAHYLPSSKHGVVCLRDGERCASAVLGASGGGTAVNEHSAVVLDDRCFVAAGDHVAALAIPDLALLWRIKADGATCFGLHLSRDETYLIVHGELTLSRLSLDGQRQWEFAGSDIFTGALVLTDTTVVVTDFEGQRYAIEVGTGAGTIVGAG